MLQGEHSAILLTFIKLPVAIKIFVLSIFEWLFYTGFTVHYKFSVCRLKVYSGFYTKLIVWGSLGLNFEYDGGPIIEIGGPIFLYKLPEDRKKQSLIRLFSN